MPNTSTHELNIELEKSNNQFIVWIGNIQAESKKYEEDGTGLNIFSFAINHSFLIKSIKMSPLWSCIIPIFKYCAPTKSSS